jgi:serine/threonine protein kinase
MADSDDRARLEARIGKTLRGKWKLERLIGIGGMAAVYAASHRNGAPHAIKILHASYARRTDARNRFLREAYIANKVGKGAVPVIDDDIDDDGSPFLVMDLLQGEPVDARAKRLGGTLPPAEVLWVASEVLVTLEHAHAHGIIHRDLKPDNLFWTRDNEVKVLDFGVARVRDANTTETTRTGVVVGTPTFMAPEQALGSITEIDGRTDLWSLGAIMFRLLTGRQVHPPTQTNALVTAATKRAPPIASVDPTVPRAIADIVDTSLRFERDQRYPDAARMRAAVERARGVDALSPTGGAAHPLTNTAAFPAPPLDARTDEGHAPASVAHDAPSESSRDRGLATGMSHDDSVALHKILKLIDDALGLRARHGPGHPKTIRAVDVAYRQATLSLVDAHIGLFWNVVPEGFVARDQFVWTPTPATARVSKELYAGGVRMIGLLPGITKPEFADVVRMIAGDLAPFSDFATFLHSSQLVHVAHRIDPTGPGMPEDESGSETPSSGPNVRRMLDALRESEEGALRVTLLSRLERWGEGHELELGAVLETAGVELAIGLLRVLHVIGTPLAREVIERATESAHPIVRIVAFTGLGDDQRVCEEVLALASSPHADVRMDALVGIEKYRIASTVAALDLHIRSRAFGELPVLEQRQTLSALGALEPLAAESVAVMLLGNAETTEPLAEAAAELLGSLGESPEARSALRRAATAPSGPVRAAAATALGLFDGRVGGGERS